MFFLIGLGSLEAGSQTAVKIEDWSYMDRSETHWDGNQLRFVRFPPVGINIKFNQREQTTIFARGAVLKIEPHPKET